MGVHVGVDVSKHHLDWVAGPEGDVARVPNSPAGIRRLVSALRKIDLAAIVVESTGGYERELTAALAKADLPIVLVTPGESAASARASGSSRRPIPSTRVCWPCSVSELDPREGP